MYYQVQTANVPLCFHKAFPTCTFSAALYHPAPLYQPTEIKILIIAQIGPRNWTYAYTNQAA